VGAYADVANAERVAQRLRAAHLGDVHLVVAQVDGRTIHRVRVGPLATAEQLNEAAARIERMGLPHPQVAVD
jgi:rare lipoprotein A